MSKSSAAAWRWYNLSLPRNVFLFGRVPHNFCSVLTTLITSTGSRLTFHWCHRPTCGLQHYRRGLFSPAGSVLIRSVPLMYRLPPAPRVPRVCASHAVQKSVHIVAPGASKMSAARRPNVVRRFTKLRSTPDPFGTCHLVVAREKRLVECRVSQMQPELMVVRSSFETAVSSKVGGHGPTNEQCWSREV